MSCDLGEIRTLDPLIKSQLLYQLSYEVIRIFRGMQSKHLKPIGANLILTVISKSLNHKINKTTNKLYAYTRILDRTPSTATAPRGRLLPGDLSKQGRNFG